MTIKDIVQKRKQLDEMDEGEDFVVGTIAGLDDETPIKPTSKKQDDKKTINKESVADMTKQNVKTVEEVTAEQLEGTVSLKLKKGYEGLLMVIEGNNEGTIIQDFDTYYQVNSKQIRITRQDAERVLGKMNDGRWRMLFMNREGEVSNFNDYEFVLGIVEAEVESPRELAQLNTRILSEAKMEMDAVRDLLNMTQSQFLEVAIREFAEKVRAEML